MWIQIPHGNGQILGKMGLHIAQYNIQGGCGTLVLKKSPVIGRLYATSTLISRILPVYYIVTERLHSSTAGITAST